MNVTIYKSDAITDYEHKLYNSILYVYMMLSL